MDPISKLREAFSTNNNPIMEGNNIVFKDGTQLDKNTKTRLEKKIAANEEFYTVYDIWFCVMNRNMTPANYGLACNSQKVNVIGAALRKRVCNYFMGDEEESVLKDVLRPIISGVGSIGKENEGGILEETKNNDLANVVISKEDLKKIMDSGRRISDYSSILITHNKEFKGLQQHAKSIFPDQNKHANNQHNRYQPQKDEEYYKSRFGDMNILGIDTRGSFVSKSVTSDSPKKSSSKNYVQQQLFADRNVKLEKPIIIVPGVVSSLLNRYNMYEFFEKSKFVEINPRKFKLDSEAPHKIEILRKKSDGELVPYEVIDNTLRMDKKDWDRVVAVFVIGQQWQLSRYPLGDDAAEFFRRYCGFYLKYENDEIPQDTISQWNVNILTVSRYERHSDQTVLLQFWNKLDKFSLQSKWNHLKM